LGEKAHLRTVAAVLANATATTLVYPSVQGPTPARGPAPAGPARAGPHTRGLAVDTGDGGSCRRQPLGGRTHLVIIIDRPSLAQPHITHRNVVAN